MPLRHRCLIEGNGMWRDGNRQSVTEVEFYWCIGNFHNHYVTPVVIICHSLFGQEYFLTNNKYSVLLSGVWTWTVKQMAVLENGGKRSYIKHRKYLFGKWKWVVVKGEGGRKEVVNRGAVWGGGLYLFFGWLKWGYMNISILILLSHGLLIPLV